MEYGTCKSILKKQKCLNCRNIETVVNHYPKNGLMRDTEPSNNTLHQTKHTTLMEKIYETNSSFHVK